jgi:hypothetical protein
MNSIDDLNSSFTTVEYDDPRPASVTFNRGTAINGTQTALEGQTINAYWGIDITSIINYDQALPVYTVNVSNNEYATVEWTDIPGYLTVSNPSTGVYLVSGIKSVDDWLAIRSPKINLPFDYSGSFTYSSSITSAVAPTKSWTTSVTVTDVVEWDDVTPPNYWYPVGTAAVPNVPQLIDVANTVISWYCIVFPSDITAISLLSTAGSGGSSEFNNETKVLTITGTNSQINSHLASLSMTTAGAGETFFNLSYRVTNLITGQSDTAVQPLKPATIRYLSTPSSLSYSEDVGFTLSSYPLITHTEAVGTETYSLTVTPNLPAAVRTMSTSGSGGTSTFNNTTKVLTITGTKTQVNSRLATISLQPGQDYTPNFTLTYFVSISPTGYNQSKTQTFTNIATHNEVSNIGFTRNFVNGVNGLLFTSDVPQITDLDPTPGNYTVTLTVGTGVGTFSAPGTTTSRTWTYTGTKAQVNALFSQITFNPAAGYFANTTVTYTQSKPGFSQVNTTFALDGPDVAFTSQTATNQSISVTEGGTFLVSVGNNIVGVNDYAITAPTYTIDVSAVPGTTVTWSTIPSGCVVTNPSSGVYRISGITDAGVWEQIKQPTISLPNYYDGVFSYTATVNWNNFANSMAWTVTVTVADVSLLTNTTSFDFYSGRTYAVTGYPQIVDTGNQNPGYIVTVAPTITSAITTMSCTGGTFNNSTKTLTISGTKEFVNAGLASISVSISASYESNIVLVYSASTDINSETSTKTQTLVKLADVTFDTLSPTSRTASTTEGGTFIQPVAANLTFINENDSPLPSYIIDLTNAPGSTVTWYSPLPSGVTASSPSANVYKLSGIDTVAKWELIKAPTINLNNYTTGTFNCTASIGYNQSSLLSWTTAVTVSPDVSLLTGVSSMTFYSGTSQSVTGYPQLVDTGSQTPTYTVAISSSIPNFIDLLSSAGTGGTTTFNNSTKVLTITGTKAQVNSHLSLLSISYNNNSYGNFNLVYSASNNLNPETGTATQLMEKLDDFIVNTFSEVTQTSGFRTGFDMLSGSNNITFINQFASIDLLPSYTINVSAIASGATVSWPTVPSGCIVTNPSTGVYKISGITSISSWNIVKNPTIYLPNQSTSTTFTTNAITISNSNMSYSWNYRLIFSDVPQLINAGGSVRTGLYTSGTATKLANPPRLNETTTLTRTVTINFDPSGTITNVYSLGSGGTTNYNSSLKRYTITGNSTEVNSHLLNLYLNTQANQDIYIVGTYSAVGSLGQSSTSRIYNTASDNFTILFQDLTYIWNNQDFLGGEFPWITTSPGVGYISTTFNLYPNMLSIADNGTGTYTVEVTVESLATSQITLNVNSSPIANASWSWNNTTKKLTITGTRTAINSIINLIIGTRSSGFTTDFHLQITVTTPSATSSYRNSLRIIYDLG